MDQFVEEHKLFCVGTFHESQRTYSEEKKMAKLSTIPYTAVEI